MEQSEEPTSSLILNTSGEKKFQLSFCHKRIAKLPPDCEKAYEISLL